MNFNKIALKMLKVNFKRYLLYFICNTFSVILFYCFAALFTNNSFMKNPSVIDTSISSNIIAPSLLVSIFIVLFVPYSHNAFQKLRRNDYGILMTLGMTEKEVLINMLFENGIIALISVASGLFIGTFISMAFYEIIIKFVGISALKYQMNIKAYGVTILFYGVVFIITVIISIFQSLKMKIIDLVKERYKADKEKKTHKAIFYIGIVMLITAVIIMIRNYKSGHSTDVWFYSMLLCLIGTYFIIGNSDIIILWLERNNKSYYLKNSLFFSDLKYHFHSTKRILTSMVWLFEFAIFFVGLCMITYPSFTKNAVTYTPYEMEFAQMGKINQISDKALEEILNSGSTKVTEEKSMEFLRNGAFNILSESQVNSTLKRNYNIKKGTFMTIFMYDLKDGYGHDLSAPEKMLFTCSDKELNLKSTGSKVDILVDKNYMADRTIIVNNDDYEQIKNTSRDYQIVVSKLFNFEDWKKSGDTVETLQQQLNKLNHEDSSELKRYKISSRIEQYKTAEQSSLFLTVTVAFVVILFWFSANIILHLKLQLEFEDEYRKYRDLYKMGMQEEEAKHLILNKHYFMFMVPVFIGAIIAMFYNYSINTICNYGWTAAKYCGIVSIIVIIIQIVFVKIYTNVYSKGLLNKVLNTHS
ncbi:ABC transporter permease [Clostridium sp. JS66]|uniref:ABC transporter permease n=1 Tax=Clostridium sp. JS66 TaxID=3064705 RepID=UPI00298EB378|nr:ABC transporter permease [Clostridium sp. JS66]WPC44280.1 ABC transporter permease [Clostridium sp. JS66]